MVLWKAASPATMLEATPDLIARGRRVYQQRCALCHGQEGDGQGVASLYLDTLPRDFTRGVYKLRSSELPQPGDEDLFRSISAGFPAYGMPSFAYLDEETRWALVHYVKSFYEGWRPQDTTPFDPGQEPPLTAESIERGRDLYENNYKCIDCHGPQGKGNGRLAEGLVDNWGRPIRPRDYTRGPAYRKGGWRRSDTVRIMATGVGGTPMIAYRSMLSDPDDLTEFWDIAAYVEDMIRRARERRAD